MADESPLPDSPLSELPSEAFQVEEDHDHDHDHDHDQEHMAAEPPTKRQKLGTEPLRATPTAQKPGDMLSAPQPPEDALSVSSDSEGEMPAEAIRPDEDEIHEQVTECVWIGCKAGDMGNMDSLVQHIHDEHIETRQKKYTCEWDGCPRLSMPHASGYALKAHMRSHTREKPFYCALPECDRAFTRSDALAKHMRTVHETEALRPSDPVPVSMRGSYKARAKSASPEQLRHVGLLHGDIPSVDPSLLAESYPPELQITAEEEAKGPEQLCRLFIQKLRWLEEESEELKKQVEIMEDLRKAEWRAKEQLLDEVLKAEIDHMERTQKERVVMPTNGYHREETELAVVGGRNGSSALSSTPQYSQGPPAARNDAATILASMHQANE